MPATPLVSREVAREATEIAEVLKGRLPTRLDGKSAVLEMQRDGCTQWRQMEWYGFYYEWKMGRLLNSALGGGPGPTYGRTQFDFERNHVWDFKAHPLFDSRGAANEPLRLNDQEAVRKCIGERKGLGFVIVEGHGDFSRGLEFKEWHDQLKGDVSDYVREGIETGRTSRPRKSAFEAKNLDFFFFSSEDDLQRGIDEGWIGGFQEGWRNSNGRPRRSKFSIDTRRVPEWARPIPTLPL